MTDRKCSTCVFCIRHDVGYSNYTVEGSNLHCSKKLHPDMPFDSWYGTDKRNLFAQTCGEYINGEGVHIDVDGEGVLRSDDPEVRWQNYKTPFVSGADITNTL